MKKRRISLSAQILSLCIWLVVIVALTISIIFMVNINRLTTNNLKNEALVSMRYLNADLQKVLTVYTDLVESTAAVLDYALSNSSPSEMESALNDLAITVPDVLSLYFGPVMSMYAPDGYYIDSSGWIPDPGWDPLPTVSGTRRQWQTLIKQ